MRKSKTLAKIRAGQPVRICCLGHYIPSFVCHAAHFGFDCIWFDCEHRAMQDREVQSILSLCHLYDIDCMVRPATLEKTRLYRLFEDGATGILVPHVSTVERAEMLVQSVKFPPIGDRGLDGAGLDSRFYLDGDENYTDRANAETFIFAQIETIEAVEAVDDIAAVEGIDGLFIGPGDLGLRIRKYPERGMTLETAMKQVSEACDRHNIVWGRPATNVDDIEKFLKMGAGFITHGGDFMALMAMLENASRNLETAERRVSESK